MLDKRFSDGELSTLELDQIFKKDCRVFFVEQKIRDDHDSSKKRGQIDNFEKKVIAVLERFNETQINGFFYFIDDSFKKNKNFYQQQIERLSHDYGITLNLVYGAQFFNQLNMEYSWFEILKHLKKWKKNIPDLPEINFDKNPKMSFEEIKNLKTNEFRKLFSNNRIKDLLSIIFPEKKTLNLLKNAFEESYREEGKTIHKTLSNLCVNLIKS